MTNLNELVASLQETIRLLGDAKELTQQQVVDATEKAHKLFLEVQRLAHIASNEDLEAFLNRIVLILQQLHQVAQSAAPEVAKYLPAPQQILQQLNQAYSSHVEPMISELQSSLQSGERGNSNQLEQLTMVAGLGQEIFHCCTEMYKYNPQMNTTEKIYSVLGTVLMFAGLGMLVAGIINPVSVPLVASLTVVTLGCYLCKKSIDRHKSPEANNIHESLYRQSEQIDAISKKFNARNYPRQLLTFSPQATVAKEQDDEQKPEFNLLQSLKNGFKNLFNL